MRAGEGRARVGSCKSARFVRPLGVDPERRPFSVPLELGGLRPRAERGARKYWMESMFVGVACFSLHIAGARSLKERRRVVKGFKDRIHARLALSVAEVGDSERLQHADVAVAVVSNEAGLCHERLSAAQRMAAALSDAVLNDVRVELVPLGRGGSGLPSVLGQGAAPLVEPGLPGHWGGQPKEGEGPPAAEKPEGGSR